MSCSVCKSELPTDGDFISCRGCDSDYHFDQCSGVKKTTHFNKSAEKRTTWRCVNCRNSPEPGKKFNFDEGKIRKLFEELKTDIREDIRNALQSFKEEYLGQLNDLKTTVENLEKKCRGKDDIINNLTHQVNQLDQYSRNKNIEIDNIEVVSGEIIEDVVLNIAKKIKINLKPEEIDAVHRLPGRKNSTSPPKVIVQLTSRKKRDLFINRRREASDLCSTDVVAGGKLVSRIFVNENLSAYNRELLWRAKVRAKEEQFRFVWFKFGKIFVKQNDQPSSPVIRVFTHADIDKIRSN
jgi:hypothetical protein